jgi:protein SEY1
MSFKTEVVAGLNVKGHNFADVVSKARARAEARFRDGSREAVITEGDPTWQWKEELQMLQKEILAVAVQLRKDKTINVFNTIVVFLLAIFFCCRRTRL